MNKLVKRVVVFLVFASCVAVLFYNTDEVGRWIYPVHHEESILRYALTYEVDPFLIASIIRVESNFRPQLISDKKAMGLMQIMPETADWIMNQSDTPRFSPDTLLRPERNIELGTWYLHFLDRYLQTRTRHLTGIDRVAVIAAAYNAGPGKLKQWLDEGRWNGRLDETDSIPYGETRHYVQRVTYYYHKYEDYYGKLWSES